MPLLKISIVGIVTMLLLTSIETTWGAPPDRDPRKNTSRGVNNDTPWPTNSLNGLADPTKAPGFKCYPFCTAGELQMSPIKRQSNQRNGGEDNLFDGGGREEEDGGGGGGGGGGDSRLENLEDGLGVDYEIKELNQSLVVTVKFRLTGSNVHGRTHYTVNWFLDTCNIYPDVEACEEPAQHFGPRWVSSNNDQVSI